MNIIGILVSLVIIALLWWAVTTLMGAFSVPAPISTVIMVFFVVLVILWLLSLISGGFGGVGGFNSINFGSPRVHWCGRTDPLSPARCLGGQFDRDAVGRLMTDEEALTLVIWGEARSEIIEGKIGVAMVVKNRWLAHYLGAQTIAEVCVQHDAFSAWSQEVQVMQSEQEMLTGDPSLAHHPDPVIRLCLEIARATIAGTLADNTRQATHYWAQTIETPYWANGVPAIRLGSQYFVRVA
jgi:hypothetical protein